MSLENIINELVGYWTLNEPSGTRLDSTDFNTNLSDISGVDSSVAIVGSGAHFTRSNTECLNSGLSSGVLDLGDEDFTFALWVSLDSKDLPAQTLLSKHRPPSDDRQFFIDFVFGGIDRFRFLINSTGMGGSTTIIEADTLGSPSANTFYFIVAWHDSTANTINIQINDGGIDSAGHTGGAFQGDAAFKLGCVEDVSENPTELLNGILDEVAVWNRTLTSDEKTSLYNGGAGVNLLESLNLPSSSGGFGGFMLSKPVGEPSDAFGGLVQSIPAQGSVSGFLGGFMDAVGKFGPSIPRFGGFAKAVASVSGVEFGGFTKAVISISGSEFGGFTFGAQPVPSGGEPGNTFGGLLLSSAPNDHTNVAGFGGLVQSEDSPTPTETFGGMVFAQPLFDGPSDGLFGGVVSGLFQIQSRIGGWMFGRSSGTQFVEQHSRTLVKVRSENVVDQGLNLDAQVTLKQRDNEEFNARLIMIETAPGAQFNVRLDIQAFKILPSSICAAVASTSGGVTQLTVCASGIGIEPGTFFTSAEIDFGEPYGFGGLFGGGGVANQTFNNSVSGFNFTTLQASGNFIKTSHDYNFPGKYIITTKFVDNLGQTHMNGIAINTIGSGSIDSVSGTPVEGDNYPALDISGLPRTGLVPTTVLVDYDLRASGNIGPVAAAATRLNKVTPSTDDFLQWNFANGNISTIKQTFSNYPNPGTYIPVARYQFIHPSGTLIATSGGAPNGSGALYESKPVWISDSLVLGFNR